MKLFQTIKDAQHYFEQRFGALERAFEQKQQMIEKNDIQIKEMLQHKYDQQILAFQQQFENEEKALKTKNEQSIYRILKLYKNRKEIISEKCKRDLAEKNERITMKWRKYYWEKIMKSGTDFKIIYRINRNSKFVK